MSERPTQTELDEANSSHAQEMEEQEVLRLAVECGVDGCLSHNLRLHDFASKLRAKDAETIAELTAWQNKMRSGSHLVIENEKQAEEIASLKAQLAEAQKVPEDAMFKIVEVAHMAGQRNQGHCDPSAYEALVYWNMYKRQIYDLLSAAPTYKKDD